ncbi:cell wall hydrolase [Sulfitobacter sp. HNIBRBA3233]|uniref:cell wall hydrolase n=1 Tax=Sulfitobacter marinivivus TaxID=3158558 RepID=UPI0032DE5B3D
MLSGYKSVAAIALSAVLVTSGLPTAVTANPDAENLLRIEKVNLNGIAPERLGDLVSGQAGQQATNVVFSREWLSQQPKPTGNSEFECLAEALYFEARGETVKGQFAVAEVIRNRVESPRFPGTYCDVINQGTGRKYQCQFTYTCDGVPEVIAEPRAYTRVAKVARAVIDGVIPDITDGATFYHTTAVRPSWARKFTQTARVGVHLFYRRNVQTASN